MSGPDGAFGEIASPWDGRGPEAGACVIGCGWKTTATTAGVCVGVAVRVSLGAGVSPGVVGGSVDGAGTSPGVGVPDGPGGPDGTGFGPEVAGLVGRGVVTGAADGRGVGAGRTSPVADVGAGETNAVPGFGPPAVDGRSVRPPSPMPNAIPTRTRLTTPSARTRRSRWAAVTGDPNPHFSAGPERLPRPADGSRVPPCRAVRIWRDHRRSGFRTRPS